MLITTVTVFGLELNTIEAGLSAVPAVPVIIGGIAYFVGALHPLAVRKPKYWQAANSTHFSCHVKNRSVYKDRSLTGITLVLVPDNVLKRVFTRWRKKPQVATVAPWGDATTGLKKKPMLISKRNEVTLEGEIRPPGQNPARLSVDTRLRIEANAGSKRSRSKRFEKIEDNDLLPEH